MSLLSDKSGLFQQAIPPEISRHAASRRAGKRIFMGVRGYTGLAGKGVPRLRHPTQAEKMGTKEIGLSLELRVSHRIEVQPPQRLMVAQRDHQLGRARADRLNGHLGDNI